MKSQNLRRPGEFIHQQFSVLKPAGGQVWPNRFDFGVGPRAKHVSRQDPGCAYAEASKGKKQ